MTATETEELEIVHRDPDPPQRVATQRGIGRAVFDVLASYGFTCCILMALMVLTYFGTVAQIDKGLVQVQKEYFDSLFMNGEFERQGIGFPQGDPPLRKS